MTQAVQVDHVVVNTLYEMDAAVEVFARLGFQLTPRGYHSLGSINHLMMFRRDYLELVGLPTGTDKIRREVADSPRGLNGLVFASEDAQAEFARLQEAGVPTEPPLDFGRPVEIDGEQRTASFRTVRLKPGYAQGGRVYFCEHRTRELVWQPQWLDHPNGVQAVAGMTVVVPDPQEEARGYVRLLPGASARPVPGGARVELDGFALDLLVRDAYEARFGAAAFRPEGREAFMGAVTLRTASLARVGNILAAARESGISSETEAGRAVVAAGSAFDAVLVFIE